MGTVHELPNGATRHQQLLSRMVEAAIADHPDPDVADRWAEMARETLARYPAPPNPSTHELDLSALRSLEAERQQEVLNRLTEWLEAWQGDVRDQLMDVHREFLLLQCRVAELEVQLASRRR